MTAPAFGNRTALRQPDIIVPLFLAPYTLPQDFFAFPNVYADGLYPQYLNWSWNIPGSQPAVGFSPSNTWTILEDCNLSTQIITGRPGIVEIGVCGGLLQDPPIGPPFIVPPTDVIQSGVTIGWLTYTYQDGFNDPTFGPSAYQDLKLFTPNPAFALSTPPLPTFTPNVQYTFDIDILSSIQQTRFSFTPIPPASQIVENIGAVFYANRFGGFTLLDDASIAIFATQATLDGQLNVGNINLEATSLTDSFSFFVEPAAYNFVGTLFFGANAVTGGIGSGTSVFHLFDAFALTQIDIEFDLAGVDFVNDYILKETISDFENNANFVYVSTFFPTYNNNSILQFDITMTLQNGWFQLYDDNTIQDAVTSQGNTGKNRNGDTLSRFVSSIGFIIYVPVAFESETYTCILLSKDGTKYSVLKFLNQTNETLVFQDSMNISVDPLGYVYVSDPSTPPNIFTSFITNVFLPRPVISPITTAIRLSCVPVCEV